MNKINSNKLREVIRNKKTFVIKFAVPGCGICAMMQPHYEEASKSTTVDFYQIDGETEIEQLSDFSVTAFPTTIVFCNGKESARFVGFMNTEQLSTFYIAGKETDNDKLSDLKKLEKTAVQCGTISSIEVRENNLLISFWDGTIKSFENIPQKIVNHILNINGKASVGNFYRTEINNKYKYKELNKKR